MPHLRRRQNGGRHPEVGRLRNLIADNSAGNIPGRKFPAPLLALLDNRPWALLPSLASGDTEEVPKLFRNDVSQLGSQILCAHFY